MLTQTKAKDSLMRDFEYSIYDFELLSEKEKTAVDWIKPRTENTYHTGNTLFSHLYGTFSVLKNFNCSESVCLAGLYHSIYGTEFFNSNIDANRENIKKIIGEYSEYLVHVFCMSGRDEIIMNNKLNHDAKTSLDLMYIFYANLIEQISMVRTPLQHFEKIKETIIILEKELENINVK